jgi:hypothetical protein
MTHYILFIELPHGSMLDLVTTDPEFTLDEVMRQYPGAKPAIEIGVSTREGADALHAVLAGGDAPSHVEPFQVVSVEYAEEHATPKLVALKAQVDAS